MMMVMVINYSSPHATLRGQVFGLCEWIREFQMHKFVHHQHLKALSCVVLICLPVCNWDSWLTSEQEISRHTYSRLCCVSQLSLSASAVFMGCLDKTMPVWPQSLRSVYATWGEYRHLPLFVFCTLLLSFFFFFNFTPAPQCSSREEESGCLRRWGCNCTPSDGVKWAGFTGVWRGGGTKKEGEKDRCKRMNCSKRQSCHGYGGKRMNEWHHSGGEVRECEIDLVAEHGEASLVGFPSGQTHFSLLRTLVSPVDALSPVRLFSFLPHHEREGWWRVYMWITPTLFRQHVRCTAGTW